MRQTPPDDRTEELASTASAVEQMRILTGPSILRAFDASIVPMAVINVQTGYQGQYLAVNRAFADQLGYTQAELVKLSIADITHPDDLMETAIAARPIREGEVDTFEHIKRNLRKDGTSLWVHAIATLIRDENGAPAFAITHILDIDKQVVAEQSLAENEARFRALVEHSADIITVIDPDLTWRSSSPAGARVLGYTAGYDPPGGILTLVHPDDLELAASALQEVRDGTRGPDEPVVFRVRRTDGTYLHIETNGQNLIDEPNIRGIVLNSRDITERLEAQAALQAQELELERLTAQAAQERLELELERARRLESLGRLAGGVAHDFNNLLGVAKIYLNSVSAGLEADSPLRDNASQVSFAIDRATALTRQLLLFGRDDDAPPDTFDPDSLIDGVLTFLATTIGDHIKVTHRFSPAPRDVCISRVRLEQVLVNTVLNARDAIEVNGEITITCEARIFEAHAEPGLPAGGEFVEIAIADTGTGMSADVLAAAVEPFFTTKQDAGTGLGLAVVYGIINKAGGKVTIDSEPGAGTTVTLLIPAG